MQFAHIDAQVIEPDMSTRLLELAQVGPGQFQGRFQAAGSGSYIINLRYRKLGETKIHIVQTPVTVPFAPEFRHLSDNAALLAEVSAITGGRILSSDAAQANLFDYTGLKFPETQLPMTRLLMLIWLAVFLLDVAVRRIATDFRAMARRVVSFLRRPLAERASFLRRPLAEHKADKTLERLRLAQNKLREQLFTRSDKSIASRRYEADEKYSGDLPTAQAPSQSKVLIEKPPEKTEPPKTEADEDKSHIQQLLRAKRKAADQRKNSKTENNE
jgi:hypothetical protein